MALIEFEKNRESVTSISFFVQIPKISFEIELPTKIPIIKITDAPII